MAITSTAPPVLSLNTIVEVLTVEIDGQRYQLHHPDALPLFARIALEAQERQMMPLLTLLDPTPDQEQARSKGLDAMCRRILDAPADVHAKLTDVHRMLIYEVFIKLPRSSRQTANAAAAAAPATRSRHDARRQNQSGASSSPGSRGSTRATRTDGSTKSRGASSGRAS